VLGRLRRRPQRGLPSGQSPSAAFPGPQGPVYGLSAEGARPSAAARPCGRRRRPLLGVAAVGRLNLPPLAAGDRGGVGQSLTALSPLL